MKKATALWPYTGGEERELSFVEGDVITVLKEDINGWWEGELDGVVGEFPANYCDITGGLISPRVLPFFKSNRIKVKVNEDAITENILNLQRKCGLRIDGVEPQNLDWDKDSPHAGNHSLTLDELQRKLGIGGVSLVDGKLEPLKNRAKSLGELPNRKQSMINKENNDDDDDDDRILSPKRVSSEESIHLTRSRPKGPQRRLPSKLTGSRSGEKTINESATEADDANTVEITVKSTEKLTQKIKSPKERHESFPSRSRNSADKPREKKIVLIEPLSARTGKSESSKEDKDDAKKLKRATLDPKRSSQIEPGKGRRGRSNTLDKSSTEKIVETKESVQKVVKFEKVPSAKIEKSPPVDAREKVPELKIDFKEKFVIKQDKEMKYEGRERSQTEWKPLENKEKTDRDRHEKHSSGSSRSSRKNHKKAPTSHGSEIQKPIKHSEPRVPPIILPNSRSLEDVNSDKTEKHSRREKKNSADKERKPSSDRDKKEDSEREKKGSSINSLSSSRTLAPPPQLPEKKPEGRAKREKSNSNLAKKWRQKMKKKGSVYSFVHVKKVLIDNISNGDLPMLVGDKIFFEEEMTDLELAITESDKEAQMLIFANSILLLDQLKQDAQRECELMRNSCESLITQLEQQEMAAQVMSVTLSRFKQTLEKKESGAADNDGDNIWKQRAIDYEKQLKKWKTKAEKLEAKDTKDSDMGKEFKKYAQKIKDDEKTISKLENDIAKLKKKNKGGSWLGTPTKTRSKLKRGFLGANNSGSALAPPTEESSDNGWDLASGPEAVLREENQNLKKQIEALKAKQKQNKES